MFRTILTLSHSYLESGGSELRLCRDDACRGGEQSDEDLHGDDAVEEEDVAGRGSVTGVREEERKRSFLLLLLDCVSRSRRERERARERKDLLDRRLRERE